jgi:hypothetical protein
MNPIPNGDIYLQPTNMIPANGQSAQMAMMAREAAGRVVRRETNALSRAAKSHAGDVEGWQQAVRDFYAEHGDFAAKALCIDADRAGRYAIAQEELVLDRGVGVVEGFEEESMETLTEMAIGERGES